MEHPLQPIVGESLSAVTFVMDYVQMAFNGACLTALTLPTVCFEDRVWAPNEPGWRDTLCGRLGVVVRAADILDAELVIEFEDSARICVSLKASDYNGPEAINFSIPGKPSIVI